MNKCLHLIQADVILKDWLKINTILNNLIETDVILLDKLKIKIILKVFNCQLIEV